MGCSGSKGSGKPGATASYADKQSARAKLHEQQQLVAWQQAPPVPFTVTEPQPSFVLEASPNDTVEGVLWRVAQKQFGFGGPAGARLELIFSEHMVKPNSTFRGAGMEEGALLQVQGVSEVKEVSLFPAQSPYSTVTAVGCLVQKVSQVVLSDAINAGDVDAVELVMDVAPARIQADDTLLRTAVLARQTVLVDMLLSTKPDLETTYTEMNNATPIILASITGATDAAALLIEAQADLSATDLAGHTALWYAHKSSQKEIIELLEAANAPLEI